MDWRAGFTLIEVLVALTIVALVSLTSLAAISASARSTLRVADRQVATILADELLVEMSLASDIDRDRWGINHRLGVPFQRYSYTISAGSMGGLTPSRLLLVRVFPASDTAAGASATGVLPAERATSP